MKARKIKCKYCCCYDTLDNLEKIPRLNKDGSPKLDKKHNPVVFYVHKKCKLEREQETKEKNEMYEYVLNKYFIHFVPPLFLKGISELRELYTYKQLKNCLSYYDEEISRCKVVNTTHLCRLLIWFLKQNINDYVAMENSEKLKSKTTEQKKIVVVKRVEDKEDGIERLKYDGIL